MVVQGIEKDFQALRDEMSGVNLNVEKVDGLENVIEKLNRTKLDWAECVSPNGGKEC